VLFDLDTSIFKYRLSLDLYLAFYSMKRCLLNHYAAIPPEKQKKRFPTHRKTSPFLPVGFPWPFGTFVAISSAVGPDQYHYLGDLPHPCRHHKCETMNLFSGWHGFNGLERR
jgi:hypothetical protein